MTIKKDLQEKGVLDNCYLILNINRHFKLKNETDIQSIVPKKMFVKIHCFDR